MTSWSRASAMWFFQMLKATFVEWWWDNTFRMAAAVAFYTLFSLSPLLVIAIAAAGVVFGRDQAQGKIAAEIGNLAGAEAERAVREISTQADVLQGTPVAFLVGIGVLFIGSTVVFGELQGALNQIWDVQPDASRAGIWSIVRDRILSFGMALTVAFLLLVSLVISAGLSAARTWLEGVLPEVSWLWQLTDFAVSVVVIALLFAVIYRYLPDAEIHWRDVAIGAAVTSVLFNVGKYLIGLYLGRMAVGSAYGTASSFSVFLIWVYYSALIFFFGAEFTQVHARRYGSGIRPSGHAVRTHQKPD